MLPHIDDFLLNLQANHYSTATAYNYKRHLEVFDHFLNESGVQFDKVNRRTITYYKAYLASRGRKTEGLSNGSDKQLGSKSINYKLTALRVYLRYLIGMGYPYPLLPEAVTLLKTVQKHAQVAEFSDLVRLIEAPALESNIIGRRDKAILETLFSTGLRVSELVSLNRHQTDLERQELGVKGKGNKIRVVLLSNRAAQSLRRYLQSRQDYFKPLFIRYSGAVDIQNNGEKMRLTARSIQNVVTKYAKRCGLPIKASPHTLRQGFATYLAEEGANPAAIQILLRHESLEAATRYVHALDEQTEEAHPKYHPLAKHG
ncbi:MAG: tyrosine-type recombinase/integrase [Dehalococcoidia bacterium]|nr:tyrosine-type recombinase/integrase [Dehalococcoidia bacterium]